MEVDNIVNRFDKQLPEPIYYDLEFDGEEIFLEFEEATTYPIRKVDLKIEDCRFFKNKKNKAQEGLSIAFSVFYSIDLAEPPELMYYYCHMPEQYPKLSAEDNGLTDLPDIRILAFYLEKEYCGDKKVAHLLQKYLLQFNWVRLRMDPNTGKFFEINEDNL